MFHLSNNLYRLAGRVLNKRFLSTTKINGPLNLSFLPLLNITAPSLNNTYINNMKIIPLNLPVSNDLNRIIIEPPVLQKSHFEYKEPIGNSVEIEAPSIISDIPKQAARLIVIRRKKMKKHKLRKLRKRMKFEWAKRRQRRELRKEKAFQAGLILQYKKAETFSAEEYVKSRLEKLDELIVQESELQSFKKIRK